MESESGTHGFGVGVDRAGVTRITGALVGDCAGWDLLEEGRGAAVWVGVKTGTGVSEWTGTGAWDGVDVGVGDLCDSVATEAGVEIGDVVGGEKDEPSSRVGLSLHAN